jgi:hypothetical protein
VQPNVFYSGDDIKEGEICTTYGMCGEKRNVYRNVWRRGKRPMADLGTNYMTLKLI